MSEHATEMIERLLAQLAEARETITGLNDDTVRLVHDKQDLWQRALSAEALAADLQGKLDKARREIILRISERDGAIADEQEANEIAGKAVVRMKTAEAERFQAVQRAERAEAQLDVMRETLRIIRRDLIDVHWHVSSYNSGGYGDERSKDFPEDQETQAREYAAQQPPNYGNTISKHVRARQYADASLSLELIDEALANPADREKS